MCVSRASELFRSRMAASVTTLPTIELRDGELLRARVGEERADRVVQPLRLAQDDVHQLRLVVAERQLLPQHLDRPRHRRQRIADLVRDAGRHLADGGQALLQPRVALQPLELGHVLEREQVSVPAVGKRDHRRHHADVEQAPVAVAVLEVDAQAARLRERGQLRPDRRRQLQDLADVLADGLIRPACP